MNSSSGANSENLAHTARIPPAAQCEHSSFSPGKVKSAYRVNINGIRRHADKAAKKSHRFSQKALLILKCDSSEHRAILLEP